MAIDSHEIEERFGFHAGTAETAPMHDEVRRRYLELALWMNSFVPAGRDAAESLTNLQQSAMWANAAIARIAPLVRGQEAARVRLPVDE
jgi:hypothetical protein